MTTIVSIKNIDLKSVLLHIRLWIEGESFLKSNYMGGADTTKDRDHIHVYLLQEKYLH